MAERFENLISAVQAEGMGAPTWRPLLDVMECELADRGGRVWMTTQEFTEWLKEQEILRRRRKDPIKAAEAVGMGDGRRRSLLHGRTPVSKAEALACAHYARRLPLPFGPDDNEAFAEFIDQAFGGARQVAMWLQMNPNTIGNQMRGFHINAKHERVPTKVDPALARALDWIVKVGPFCPYGELRSPRKTEV